MSNPFEKSEQKEPKRDDRPVIVSSIIAIAALLSLLIGVLSSNLPLDVRSLTVILLNVLLVMIFLAVYFVPLRTFISILRTRSRAEKIANRRLSELLELNEKFKHLVSPHLTDSLASVLIEIRRPNFMQSQVLDITYFYYSQVSDIIAELAKQPVSFHDFKTILDLFTVTIGDFNRNLRNSVVAIRRVRENGQANPFPDLEQYRLVRIYYINFLTSLRQLEERLQHDLALKPTDYNSPYAVPSLYHEPPPEL